MRRLVLVWAVWRLTRRVGAIALIAALGVLLLSGGVTGHRGRGAVRRVERAGGRSCEISNRPSRRM
jgi:hypothetical protein